MPWSRKQCDLQFANQLTISAVDLIMMAKKRESGLWGEERCYNYVIERNLSCSACTNIKNDMIKLIILLNMRLSHEDGG